MASRQNKYPDTEIFKYHNQNPHNRITTDCVLRALSFGLGIPYNDMVMEVAKIQCKTGFDPLDRLDLVFKNYGIEKQPMLRHYDNTKYTLKEFIKENPKGTYIVNMPGHVTVIKDGKNYDIWDCTKSKSKVGNYWKIN